MSKKISSEQKRSAGLVCTKITAKAATWSCWATKKIKSQLTPTPNMEEEEEACAQGGIGIVGNKTRNTTTKTKEETGANEENEYRRGAESLPLSNGGDATTTRKEE